MIDHDDIVVAADMQQPARRRPAYKVKLTPAKLQMLIDHASGPQRIIVAQRRRYLQQMALCNAGFLRAESCCIPPRATMLTQEGSALVASVLSIIADKIAGAHQP